MRPAYCLFLTIAATSPLLAGSGSSGLLQSSPSSGSTGSSPPPSPSYTRPDWSNPRSLLDDRPPPTSADQQTRDAWQNRDLPRLDQDTHDMNSRYRPNTTHQFLEDQDWRRAQQNQQPPQSLPKPPTPPTPARSLSDVTPFDLAPTTRPATQPAQTQSDRGSHQQMRSE